MENVLKEQERYGLAWRPSIAPCRRACKARNLMAAPDSLHLLTKMHILQNAATLLVGKGCSTLHIAHRKRVKIYFHCTVVHW